MGEVYRAHDTRLNRDVAIKILPASFSSDPDRMQRFAQESRAAAALNHPNILSIYDIGDDRGIPYVVSELLEGESLRERLRGGAISSRKAIDYAQQIAKGLAAAHERGIIHRDLKPENLFLTNDGRVKILDFGLAKFIRPEGDKADEAPTMQVATEVGTVLGTAGYMSPEQVRGKISDARSDIFSFGAILYEMLSGKRAFRGDSSADTMSAILREDPLDLNETDQNLSPALGRVVRHCLEKNPSERFQSARDLAFDFETLSDVPTTSRGAMQAGLAPKLTRHWLLQLIAGLLLLASWAGIYRYATHRAGAQNPTFHEITFHNGTVWGARFAPDGQSIVYSAAWEGRPQEVFSARFDSADSRSMDLPSALVLAVSSKGEMAVALRPVDIGGFEHPGTLARVALAGGAPREVLENVPWADWSPDGQSLAAVHAIFGALTVLEFPLGNLIYKPNGWVSHVRFSPKGNLLAVADHIPTGDDGRVVIVDTRGNHKTSSSFYASVEGLAWSPDGKEVWFSAIPAGSARAIYALDLFGKERLIYRAPSGLTIHDINREGLVLLTADKVRIGISAHVAGENRDRSLSWFDWSAVTDMSPDGKAIIFSETGEAVGANYGIYLRKTDGSPAVRIGDGDAGWFSPDGHWVLGSVGTPTKLVLLPIGVGEPKQLIDTKMDVAQASWLPDGKAVVYSGVEAGGDLRTYLLDLQKGVPRPLAPAGFFRERHHPGWEVRVGYGSRTSMLDVPHFGRRAEEAQFHP
jgi:Tol biopolymer transport system component